MLIQNHGLLHAVSLKLDKHLPQPRHFLSHLVQPGVVKPLHLRASKRVGVAVKHVTLLLVPYSNGDAQAAGDRADGDDAHADCVPSPVGRP